MELLLVPDGLVWVLKKTADLLFFLRTTNEIALLMSEVSSGGTRVELDGAIAPSETYLAPARTIYILRHQYKPTRFIILFIA